MRGASHPAAIEVGGEPYLRDAKGALVPILAIKPTDLLMDELVRELTAEALWHQRNSCCRYNSTNNHQCCHLLSG